MFQDREEAGELLAENIKTSDSTPDLVVAVPKGGVPVGKTVSEEIEAPLDIVTAAPLKNPQRSGQDIGAVSADGTLWLQDSAVEIDVSGEYVEKMRVDKTAEALQQYRNYAGRKNIPMLSGKKVLVVSDVLEEESALMAALGTVKKSGPEKITVAAPVMEKECVSRVEGVADELCVIEESESTPSVSTFYGVSEEVSEEELKNVLFSS